MMMKGGVPITPIKPPGDHLLLQVWVFLEGAPACPYIYYYINKMLFPDWIII